MKSYFLTAVLLHAILWGASAQNLKTAQVPATVQSELLKRYPEASHAKVNWEKEKGNYEANWGGKSGEDNSALFTPAGTFIELVKAIPVTQLPATAIDYIQKHENGAKIKEAGLITDAQGVATYKAEIKGKELIFDKSGNYLKSE